MNSKHLTREQKIKLLNDIEAGRKDIKEILPKIHEVWYEVDRDISKIFINKKSKEELSALQLDERMKSDKRNVDYIKITRGDRHLKTDSAPN